eukprot:351208-Chlamydomonas_euryale.AAC.7
MCTVSCEHFFEFSIFSPIAISSVSGDTYDLVVNCTPDMAFHEPVKKLTSSPPGVVSCHCMAVSLWSYMIFR